MGAEKILLKIFIILTILVAVTSCVKSDSDDSGIDTNVGVVASAFGEVNHAATADEGGAVGFIDTLVSSQLKTLAVCAYTGYTCSGSVKNIDWNACTTANATLTGGWTETYTSAGCCSSFGASCAVTRITSTNGSLITFSSGASITTSSEQHNTYSGVAIPGPSGVSSLVSAGNRTININGLHRISRTPAGSVIFDHSLRTTSAVTITGARASSNRTVNGGVIEVFHNRAGYTATSTFSGSDPVRWSKSACCYPTAGTITTTFTGSRIGNTTLKFLSTCGTATFTDIGGSVSSITLSQCE